MTRKGRSADGARDGRVDEIAAQLDDVGMTIDEVAADPGAADVPDKLKEARATVDQAVDTIDEIADREPKHPRR